jgi:hypothetical protein
VSDHDQLFKTLIRRFFGDLVRIVVPDVARELRLDRVKFLESEMFTDVPEGERRQLDVVAEVETVDDEIEIVVVHVEVEARARGRSMDERMWRYAMQLRLRRGRPVVPLVVYLTGGEPDVHEVTVEDRFAGRRLASFSYSTFALGPSEAARYLDRPETLAPALAALMDPGELSPARHKLACLRRIARAEVDDAGRFLLVNCVETYVQWSDEAGEEYDALLAGEENREVTTMEMTWADRMQLKGMKQLVTGMIETRFGEVPAERKQRIEAIDSPEEMTRLADRLLVARSLDDLGI